LDQAVRGLRALLHHVAELAGELQAPAARRAGRLDEQDVAADRGPGKACRHARYAGAHRHLVLEPHGPEDPLDVLHADMALVALALGELDRDRAQHAADLALQVTD